MGSQNMIKDIDRQLNDLKTGSNKAPKNQRKQAVKKAKLTKLMGYNQGSNPQKHQKKKNNPSQKKKQAKEAPKSQEQLDMELAQYMQKTKGGLDAELDCYMSQTKSGLDSALDEYMRSAPKKNKPAKF